MTAVRSSSAAWGWISISRRKSAGGWACVRVPDAWAVLSPTRKRGPQNRPDLNRSRQAMRQHHLDDLVGASERTGEYHWPRVPRRYPLTELSRNRLRTIPETVCLLRKHHASTWQGLLTALGRRESVVPPSVP